MNTLASKVILITSKKEAQEKEKEARKEIRSKREKKEARKKRKKQTKKRRPKKILREAKVEPQCVGSDLESTFVGSWVNLKS